MATTYNWSQAIEAGGQAIQNGHTRNITLNGTYVLDTSAKTATILVKSITVQYSGGYQNTTNFYLDGKILINGSQVYVSASSPAKDYMQISGNGTFTTNLSATSVVVNYTSTPPTFTVQLTKNSFSAFFWIQGNATSSQWTAVDTTYTVRAVCTITYNKNGGSGSMGPYYVAYGGSHTVKSNSFTAPAGTENVYTITLKANYTGGADSSKTVTNSIPKIFNTWRQGSTTGTQRNPSASITNITSNITLYATWKDGTEEKGAVVLGALARSNGSATGYTVSFNTQGGSSVSSKTSTRTIKYTQDGWTTSASGTTIAYDTTTAYSFSANTTIYAKWSETYTNNSITLPAAPTRTGYNFLGWGASSTATSYKQPGASITPSKNTTYYAFWKANGLVRIYVNDTDKYKTAMAYIYKPDGDNDQAPWKMVIPYIKTETDWKIVSG